MIPLIGAILVASLLGSLHCAGMCGAFVAFAVGSADASGSRRMKLNAAYQLGRLVTYTLLGVIAGSLGAALDIGGGAVGLPPVAAVIAGSVMVVIGVVALMRIAGARVKLPRVPVWMQRAVGAGQRVAMALPPIRRALLIGMLTTLLPCGWLWAFVVTSAGTGDPVWGGVAMATFWVGTLPVLVSLGFGVQKLLGALAPRLSAISAVAVIVVGLYTTASRMAMPSIRLDASAARAAASEDVVRHVRSLDSKKAPCCVEHAK